MKRKLIMAIILLLLVDVICTSSISGTSDANTLICYSTDDTYISEREINKTYGSVEAIEVRTKYGESSSNWEQDILVKFDMSSLPSDVYITSALLYLNYYEYIDNDPTGRDLTLYQVNDEWNEDTVTWNDKPRKAGYTTANSTIPSTFGWMNWNVTSDVQEYVDGQWENYGWQIIDENTWGRINIPTPVFYSKETADKKPYLEVKYTLEKPNTPPTADAGGPYSQHVNHSILFDGSGSSDSDGTITGYRWDFTNDSIWDTAWLTIATTTYTYNSTGNYTVILQVKDDDDAIDEDTANVQVIVPNNPPTANANGPYFGYTNEAIAFNGTNSSDSDGTIISHSWYFGDGTNGTGELVNHSYNTSGNYTVNLTVTDDAGEIAVNTTYAIIKQNYPPDKPVLNGTTIGTKNTEYNYTAVSTDINNDNIRYIFDWGDDTNTTSDFLPNSIIFNTTHIWTVAGKYTITVYTIDRRDATSETVEFTVLIDAHYVGDIGYLIDSDNDEIYDLFYSNAAENKISVEREDNGVYLIDEDGDGIWDYIYDSLAGTTTSLKEDAEDKTTTGEISWIMIAAIFLAIATTVIIVLFYRKKQILSSSIRQADEKIKEIDQLIGKLKNKHGYR